MQSTNFPVQVTIPFKQLVSIINDMDLEKKLLLKKEIEKSIIIQNDKLSMDKIKPMTLKEFYLLIAKSRSDVQNNRLVELKDLKTQSNNW